ncbi:hypothetical protein G7Y89_g3353 [Cudoniella acicularis]|uniref:Uncharacterized protein n=1 Tax=Cudoniella acicularis TaxID=354080 RepID=A0A8H4RTL4_9HELO|nr:hypothetical protein G7Y89_g3353 [Cudoniella acicularis]
MMASTYAVDPPDSKCGKAASQTSELHTPETAVDLDPEATYVFNKTHFQVHIHEPLHILAWLLALSQQGVPVIHSPTFTMHDASSSPTGPASTRCPNQPLQSLLPVLQSASGGFSLARSLAKGIPILRMLPPLPHDEIPQMQRLLCSSDITEKTKTIGVDYLEAQLPFSVCLSRECILSKYLIEYKVEHGVRTSAKI